MCFFCFSFSRYKIKLKNPKHYMVHSKGQWSQGWVVWAWPQKMQRRSCHWYSFTTYSCCAGSYDLQNTNTFMSLNASNGSKWLFFYLPKISMFVSLPFMQDRLEGESVQLTSNEIFHWVPKCITGKMPWSPEKETPGNWLKGDSR